VQIIPAIDLRGGQCVRLRQGDYAQETVFGNDPAAMARHWVDLGATMLHLVDLDGAREGRPVNLSAIQGIVASAKVPCELGGGLRQEQDLRLAFDLGIERVVIGTQALKNPDWFATMAQRFPGKLLLGVDAKQGRVATEGWLEVSSCPATQLAKQFESLPIAGLIYTDIARDGMMAGPNVEAMYEMAQAVKLPVIASGGVTTLNDVRALARLPLAACIVGRALYEGTLLLPEAIRVADGREITQKS
jgi:phosphoribosylformimino-5-aminoimidazole carboxamide ribotide isomerase